MVRDRTRTLDPGAIETLAAEVRRIALPLSTREDLDPLIEQIGNAHFVLLGEASHGTSEYYQWRARLSSRLIAEKGFNFVAVEGDWPDCYQVNRYVKGYPDAGDNAREVLHAFNRWPTWMWANWEVVAFAEWMRKFNKNKSNKAVSTGLMFTACGSPWNRSSNTLRERTRRPSRRPWRHINVSSPIEKIRNPMLGARA